MKYTATTDPALRCFLEVAPGSDFPIQNLPYGVMRRAPTDPPHVGVAIGDLVVDLTLLEVRDFFTDPALRDTRPFARGTLNAFMALGPEAWSAARSTISRLLTGENPSLVEDTPLQEQVIVPQRGVEMLLPVEVGDYTDFYASREHATNVGTMFRGPENALMPNWLHLPVAYHGRASSVVVSGTPIRRPKGQRKSANGQPEFGATLQLDFELEVGAIIGTGNALGTPIPIAHAHDHVFGLVLVNDWSARDIQSWEYQPLGPFLGKNFATTMSPWVVPMDALAPFRVEASAQDPEPLAYLRDERKTTYDLHLEVGLLPSDADKETTISRSNFRRLYWTLGQQVAHHTVNGCNLRPGDLLASGTISGPEPESRGCLLERTWRGTEPLPLRSGGARTFLEDGDTVTLRGWAEGTGYRVGFGACEGRVEPA